MKRFFLTLVVATIALVAMIGVEIVLALRREYLPTDPALEIGGTFGETTDPEMTFAVLGDSTAAGVGAGDPERAYATLLAKRIAAEGYRVHLVAFGVSGARTHDVLRDQVPLAVEARPDLAFVGVGANDVTHLTPLDEVRADASELVQRLRATGADVVIAGAPDMPRRGLVRASPVPRRVAWARRRRGGRGRGPCRGGNDGAAGGEDRPVLRPRS